MASPPQNSRPPQTDVNPSILPEEEFPEEMTSLFGGAVSADVGISYRVNVTERIPAWPSRPRDKWLHELLHRSDMLASAMQTFVSTLQSIPVKVAPVDEDDDRAKEIAATVERLLQFHWTMQSKQVLQSWMGIDNGFFVEIIGKGHPAGPIEPTRIPGTRNFIYATGLRALDPLRATRTGDPEYPVRYDWFDSRGRPKQYRFHRTRIMYGSQMPSIMTRHHGYGFSAVSRCAWTALHLQDVAILEEEYLGGRPASELIVGKGIEKDTMQQAFRLADERMDAEGLRRMAKAVFISLMGNPDMLRASGIEINRLKRFPDGFSKEESLQLGALVISMAFGFRASLIWPSNSTGGSGSESEERSTRQQTPGVFVRDFTAWLNHFFAPMSVRVAFDHRDDMEDKEKADIEKTVHEAYQVAIESGQITPHVAQMKLLSRGLLTPSQYDVLQSELEEQQDVAMVEATLVEDPTSAQQEALGVASPDNSAPEVETRSAGPEEVEIVTKQDRDSVSAYDEALRAIFTDLIDGSISGDEAMDDLKSLSQEMISSIYRRGANKTEGTLTLEDRIAINDLKRLNRQSARLVVDTFKSKREQGDAVEGQTPERFLIEKRKQWVNKAYEIYWQAVLTREDKQASMLRWDYADEKEHCADCQRLHNQVHSVAHWRSAGWVPRSSRLACKGFNCGCRFVEVRNTQSTGGF